MNENINKLMKGRQKKASPTCCCQILLHGAIVILVKSDSRYVVIHVQYIRQQTPDGRMKE